MIIIFYKIGLLKKAARGAFDPGSNLGKDLSVSDPLVSINTVYPII